MVDSGSLQLRKNLQYCLILVIPKIPKVLLTVTLNDGTNKPIKQIKAKARNTSQLGAASKKIEDIYRNESFQLTRIQRDLIEWIISERLMFSPIKTTNFTRSFLLVILCTRDAKYDL